MRVRVSPGVLPSTPGEKMIYPKEIYKNIKPLITIEEATARAEKEKPRFKTDYIRIKGRTASEAVKSLNKIIKEYGDVRVQRGRGNFDAVVKIQIPVEARAKKIRSDDRIRRINARFNAESNYRQKRYDSQRRAASQPNQSSHCSCCACSNGK
jgi:hypothetical protein